MSTDEFREFDYAVMHYIFETQNTLGRLADERVYQAEVARILRKEGYSCSVEVPVKLIHKTFVKDLYLDLVVSRKAVYEFKTVTALSSSHAAQVLTYIYMLDLPHAKLVNFRTSRVESKFVNAPIDRDERTNVAVSDNNYRGDQSFRSNVVDLVRDWGIALSVSLYREAMTHLLGGRSNVERMLALTRDNQEIATQRFYLLDPSTAFEFTAYSEIETDYHLHLQRLLLASPLESIQWVNIGKRFLTFRSIERP